MVRKPVLLYKTLVFGVIVLFILLSPSTLAITKERINHAPEAPEIMDAHPRGRCPCPIGFNRSVKFTTIDPDGDDIFLSIEWEEGFTYEEWLGPYKSGEEVVLTHTFIRPSLVKARAMDKHGAIGPWGEEIIIIQDIQKMTLFSRLIGHFQFLEVLLRIINL